MPPRTRSSGVQKASWRGRGGSATSGSLLFYRRAVTTALSALLLACFAWLLWYIRSADQEPLAASIVLTEPKQGAAPPPGYAEHDKTAVQAVLNDRFPRRVTEPPDNAGLDVQHLGETIAGTLKMAREADPRQPVLVYVSGHGVSATLDGEGAEKAYLLPVDFSPTDPSDRRYAVSRLLAEMAAIPSQCIVLAIDYGPIERDLRLGTAVNRFADILAAELDALKLADDQRLVVITSHRTWERSLAVPAADGTGRGVFSYFFTAALGGEGAESSADEVSPDEAQADQQISVAELARFLQQQVSTWVWENSGYERTQRPLVLVKTGSDAAERLELTERLEEPSKGAEVLDSLAEVVLCRAPAKTPAKAVPEASPPAEKSAEKVSAGKSAARWTRALSVSLVQNPAVPAESGNKASSTKGDAAPPADTGATPAATAATAPSVAAPPAADTPPPPDWLVEQADALAPLLATGASDWSLADYAVATIRDQLEFLLDRQQREFTDLGPRRGERLPGNVNALGRHGWLTPQITEIDAVPWAQAVRTRNQVLLQLPLLIDAVERVEGSRSTALRSQLDDLLTALERLVNLTDRDILTETREKTDSTLYAPLTLGSALCDTKSLAAPHTDLVAAHDQLLASLRMVLSPPAPTPVDWLNAWELGQAIPLGLLEARVPPPTLQAPQLAVRRLQDKAADRPSTDATPESVENGRLDDRKRWLQVQIRVAKLLGSESLLGSNPLGDAKAADSGRLNRVAAQLRNAHSLAADFWVEFNVASTRASEHLKADRCGRLALALAGQPAKPPEPGPALASQAPPVRLGLTGPVVGTGAGASSVGDGEAIHLVKDAATDIAWGLRTDDPSVRDGVQVSLEFDERDFQLQTRSGQRIAPTRPGQGPLPLADLLVSGELALRVRASREIRPDEAKQPGGNSKPLVVTLLLGDKSILGAARFQLPDPRYLDVQIAGFPATVRRGADVAEPTGEAGRSWFKMLPDDSQSPRRPESGDFRVELFPFPRYTTEFGLRLISARPRNLVATWYVPQPPVVPTDWPMWQRAADSALVFKRAPVAVAPGVPWHVPLYEAPPAAPPAAGAAPPIPVPDPLPIENGLLLVLTDEQDPEWRQRIWVHARPLHPDQYLSLQARYLTGKPGAPSDSIEVAINSLSDVRDHLQPGALPVTWFELSDPRIGRPAPAARDFSLPNQPPVVAQLAPEAEPTGGSILAILTLEGYPRGARFPGIRPSDAPVEHDRQPYLYLQLFEELPPAAPLPPGTPVPPPVLKLLEPTKYVTSPLRLAYKLFADFDPRLGHSLRLVENGNASSPLVRRLEDRQFEIAAHKPASPTGPQFVLDCKIGEWQASLGETQWLRLGKNVLRAEIVTAEGGQERPLAADGCSQEFVIVFDDEKPKVRNDVTAVLPRFVGENVLCKFSVLDVSLAGADATGGVAIEGLSWGIDVKGDALVDPRPIIDTVKDGPNKPSAEATGKSILCELPAEIATAKPGRVRIYVQATDRAGNVSVPTKVLELEVKMKRELELIPGGGKAAKAKS
jgi:hypothetical protein